MEKDAANSYNQKKEKMAQYSAFLQSFTLSCPQLSTIPPQTTPS